MRKSVLSARDRLRGRKLQAAEELGNWEDWRALGGQVYFAETAEQASVNIKNVVEKNNSKKIVESKSMVT